MGLDVMKRSGRRLRSARSKVGSDDVAEDAERAIGVAFGKGDDDLLQLLAQGAHHREA